MRVQPALTLGAVLAFACSRPDEGMGAGAEQQRATCVGPADAMTFAVYLHGMDTPEPSPQESGNRANIARVADRLSIRIAMPRARRRCPTNSDLLCWGWAFTDDELEAATEEILAAAERCFGSKAHGVIGFSNGGYLVSKMYRTCKLRDRLPNATWAVTFGSAVLHGPLEPEPASLAGCGRLVVATGTEDSENSDPDDALVRALQAKGGDVTAVRFPGGHLVPRKPLYDVLQPLVRP